MPITLPETLPAFDILSKEGVMVMSPGRAATQDIRPLRIAIITLSTILRSFLALPMVNFALLFPTPILSRWRRPILNLLAVLCATALALSS